MFWSVRDREESGGADSVGFGQDVAPVQAAFEARIYREDFTRSRGKGQPRSNDGLFLELIVPNSVVAGNDDPAVQPGFSEPDNILGALRKKLVVDADLDTGGAQRLGHFLSAQRSVDEEYEGLRRLSPAEARSGPPPRC